MYIPPIHDTNFGFKYKENGDIDKSRTSAVSMQNTRNILIAGLVQLCRSQAMTILRHSHRGVFSYGSEVSRGPAVIFGPVCLTRAIKLYFSKFDRNKRYRSLSTFIEMEWKIIKYSLIFIRPNFVIILYSLNNSFDQKLPSSLNQILTNSTTNNQRKLAFIKVLVKFER